MSSDPRLGTSLSHDRLDEHIPADQVLIQDRFLCAGDGSADTPPHQHFLGGLSLSSMVVDVEGNVTVHCVPEPVGND